MYIFITKLGINSAVCIMCIDNIWRENLPLLLLDFYELIAIVATRGRYGCTIAMSHTEINKTGSQWSLTFNQCLSISWPLTCVFHVPCMRTPEIIDMHKDVSDKYIARDGHPEKKCPSWKHLYFYRTYHINSTFYFIK